MGLSDSWTVTHIDYRFLRHKLLETLQYCFEYKKIRPTSMKTLSNTFDPIAMKPLYINQYYMFRK